MNNKYQSLNVLNYKKHANSENGYLLADDAINELAGMLDASGNRKSRRKIEKVLSKTAKIQERADARANKRAYSKIEERVDEDFMYIFGIIGITMYEDYHWKETEDNEHGQITSLYERLTKKMEKYTEMGYSTEDILNHLDELTGIRLVSTFNKP